MDTNTISFDNTLEILTCRISYFGPAIEKGLKFDYQYQRCQGVYFKYIRLPLYHSYSLSIIYIFVCCRLLHEPLQDWGDKEECCGCGSGGCSSRLFHAQDCGSGLLVGAALPRPQQGGLRSGGSCSCGFVVFLNGCGCYHLVFHGFIVK